MSSIEKEILAAERPRGFSGRGDKYLGDIARDLRKLLERTQDDFADPGIWLDEDAASELAVVLAEFAEDVHADVGLWRTLETHNQQCFGSPLPFLVETGDPLAPSTFDPRRVQYLLWTLLPSLLGDPILSPTHGDLQQMAQAVSAYLPDRFAKMPKDSGVALFLTTPNRYGWEVKRKLIWLGRHSYLFRFFFQEYMEENDRPMDDVGATDDFLCQQCTVWSGLGAIDVLAGALDVSEEDREVLRNWYERHTAFFRVLTRKDSGDETEFITVRNIINEETYVVRMNVPNCPFAPGMMIFGALTPWRGEWYWSGEQRTYRDLPEKEEAGLRKEMLQGSTSGIAYRYCPALADRARQIAREQHSQFVSHYGSDLAVFPDGLSLVAAEQQRMERQWRTAPPQKVAAAMAASGSDRPAPKMTFPPSFLEENEGFAAFSDPSEGVEYLPLFQHVLSGMQKKGVGMTETEASALFDFMLSPLLSAAFVRRLVADDGAESIAAAFSISGQPLDLALEFLLRCHKGTYFRKRYPAVSVVNA